MFSIVNRDIYKKIKKKTGKLVISNAEKQSNNFQNYKQVRTIYAPFFFF